MRAAGYPPFFIQNAAFKYARGPAEWNIVGKIEIAAGFDQGEMHVRGAWIRDNSLDLCYGEVTPGSGRFDWLVIDDPVARARLGATEILLGKLSS